MNTLKVLPHLAFCITTFDIPNGWNICVFSAQYFRGEWQSQWVIVWESGRGARRAGGAVETVRMGPMVAMPVMMSVVLCAGDIDLG